MDWCMLQTFLLWLHDLHLYTSLYTGFTLDTLYLLLRLLLDIYWLPVTTSCLSSSPLLPQLLGESIRIDKGSLRQMRTGQLSVRRDDLLERMLEVADPFPIALF